MAGIDEAERVLDSRLLYKLCCNVGFSREAWKHRVRCSDVLCTTHSYSTVFADCYYCQCSGSASEGVAASFLGSDIDVMQVMKGTRVAENDFYDPNDPDHIYRPVLSRHPAFVQLQLIHQGTYTRDDRKIPTPLFCDVDRVGRRLLNGSEILTIQSMVPVPLPMTKSYGRHGPAITTSYKIQPETEIDFVFSLHCPDWPACSSEWLDRHRQYGRPSPRHIQTVASHGCELVTKGNPENPDEEERAREWRFSSSLAERILIRSMNEIQIQCYFLLKLILRFLVKPLDEESLSSYHMKNVILHVVENTDPRWWTKDNLTNCFMTCVWALHMFLEAGYLPQYFILAHNLLLPRVQNRVRVNLLRIVGEILSEGWNCIQRCQPFVKTCLHETQRCFCQDNTWSIETHRQSINHQINAVRFQLRVNSHLLHDLSGGDLIETLRNFIKVVAFDESTKKMYFPSACSADVTRKILRCHIGYMLLNLMLNNQRFENKTVREIMNISHGFLKKNCNVDLTSCRLKLATFYFQTGAIYKCVQTVNYVLQHYTMTTLPLCINTYRFSQDVYTYNPRRLSAMMMLQPLQNDFQKYLSHVAYSVQFSRWEIPCAPTAVQGLTQALRRVVPHDYQWPSVVNIDPIVYSYFLLFISYMDLGDRHKARRSLDIMTCIVRHPVEHMVYLPEIAENLLDYCKGLFS